MLTFDDKGGWGVKNPQKPAYVIHGCSLNYRCFQAFVENFEAGIEINGSKLIKKFYISTYSEKLGSDFDVTFRVILGTVCMVEVTKNR